MSTSTRAGDPPPRQGNFVFVYGSLRPDDDSGMPWTQQAVQGMTAQRSTLLHAKLYQDAYARMVLLQEHQHQDDDPNSSELGGVHGWVLSTADPRLFQEKMALFDEIEGVSTGFYKKDKAVARLLSPEDCIHGGDDDEAHPLGQTGELLQVYCYHRSHPIDVDTPSIWIESGDWMDRKRN